jgi:hypothetical protein
MLGADNLAFSNGVICVINFDRSRFTGTTMARS